MIYELNNFLTLDECNNFIYEIENSKVKTNFTDSGKFDNKKWINTELAEKFYRKLETYPIYEGERILRPNNLIMSGKYNVGDSFSLHTDTGLFYDRKAQEKSLWTLLIYLNDNFKGGETVFYDDFWKIDKIVKPIMGTAILFDIDLWHCGNELLKGTKYWIGCEIIGKFKN